MGAKRRKSPVILRFDADRSPCGSRDTDKRQAEHQTRNRLSRSLKSALSANGARNIPGCARFCFAHVPCLGGRETRDDIKKSPNRENRMYVRCLSEMQKPLVSFATCNPRIEPSREIVTIPAKSYNPRRQEHGITIAPSKQQ